MFQHCVFECIINLLLKCIRGTRSGDAVTFDSNENSWRQELVEELTRTVFSIWLSIIGKRRTSRLSLFLLHATFSWIQVESSVLNTLINLASRLQKCLFNILSSHGARLRKHQTILISKLLRLFVRHLASRFQIALVSNQKYYSRRICEIFRVGQPSAEMVVSRPTCDVVNHQTSGSSSIITSCHSSESLLARSLKNKWEINMIFFLDTKLPVTIATHIPNLKFNFLFIYFDDTSTESVNIRIVSTF